MEATPYLPYLLIFFGFCYACVVIFSFFSPHDSDPLANEKYERKRRKENADNKLDLFNPNKERSTYVRILDNIVHFKTDIQHIEVNNDALAVRISSVVENEPLKFNLLVKPFSFLFLKIEDYHKYNLDGMMSIEMESNKTRTALLLVDELKLIAETIYDEPRKTYLYTSSYIIDRISGTIEIEGYFDDKNKFNLSIDSDNFKLYVTAPISSLQNKSNFKDYNLLGLLP